ncbi:MAG: hypothetical protein P4M08_10495 [Oligoflexia bacterium]|nr:hypothetical protein [Oligoflexia bacterium]
MVFKKTNYLGAIILALVTFPFQACSGSGGGTPGAPTSSGAGSLPGAPTTAVQRSWTTDAMLFVGDGTWSTETDSIQTIFKNNGVSYQAVTSAQLDAMTLSQLTQFGMFVFPGGEGGTEAGSVSAQTHANLRAAVQQYGVSYIGFCAGAFIAVAPAPAAGQDVSYGFGVVDGPLENYYQLENQGVNYQSTVESFPDSTTMPILWYGGPVTPSTGVIAKYPTGDPAISEMWSGTGFVVLSGVHPTMTQADLDGLGVTPDTDDTAFAWKLFNAALHQQPLPTY